jgi:predicted Rossmann fold nucleotide-binding protein DprA/Smf involved in DNA uptake
MEILDIEKQAILLLTSYFKKPGGNDVKPLTPTEWKKFASWLIDKRYTPGSLLTEDGENIIDSWDGGIITKERLFALLNRGAQMSVMFEKWSRAGIWILTRSDLEYPKKLKKRLGQLSPPVLYGAGNKALLNLKGVAVVGSRNISDEDLNSAKELGRYITENNLAVISGGAKGVDEASMLGTLENGGKSIGILADGLFERSFSKTYRNYLSEGNLVLISPYYPEAGFNVGNAMGRNKYIYCLSEAAVVIHSGLKGGTWTGANENLKNKWVPLFVKENFDKDCGNNLLIKNGGKVLDKQQLLESVSHININEKEFSDHQFMVSQIHEPQFDLSYATPKEEKNEADKDILHELLRKDFYDLFLIKLKETLKNGEVKKTDLPLSFDLISSQLNTWLAKAEEEKVVKKLSKPVRYILLNQTHNQTDLFSGKD